MNCKKKYERIFIAAMCLLIACWFVIVLVEGPASSQLNLFFRRFGDFWADMTNVVGYSSQLDPYNNMMYMGLAEKGYPPLVYCITYLFSRLVDMQPHYDADYFLDMYSNTTFLMMYLMYLFAVLVFGYEVIRSLKNGKKATKFGVAFAIMLSGPVLFTVERGNIILLTAFLCAMFVAYYDSKNCILKEAALISLGVAAGLKMTPALLGCLLLLNRQWKDAVRAVLYGMLFFFVPFLFLKGGFANIPLMFRNMGLLMEKYASASGCTIRNLLTVAGKVCGIKVPQLFSKALSMVVAVVLAAYAFVARTKWEKVLALVLIMVTVPNYSGYYCTLYFIPVIVLFLNEEEHKAKDIVALVAFLLILNPIYTPLRKYGLDTLLGIALLLAFALISCFVRLIGKKAKTAA